MAMSRIERRLTEALAELVDAVDTARQNYGHMDLPAGYLLDALENARADLVLALENASPVLHDFGATASRSFQVGEFIEVDGERRRITAIRYHEAEEDDPRLSVMSGDMVTTLTLEVVSRDDPE